MKDRRSIIAADEALEDSDWSKLVSVERHADGSRPIAQPRTPHAPVVGTIVGITDDRLLVTYPGQVGGAAVPCRTLIDVTADGVGRQVLLMFEEGDARQPIVIGCLRQGNRPSLATPATVEVVADGGRITVTAKDRIVLRCGKASITLTEAGKVILEGEYISQRSMGVVRIKGGCVEIN